MKEPSFNAPEGGSAGMQKAIIAAWIFLAAVFIAALTAEATVTLAQNTRSHPTYDSAPVPELGSRPIYDNTTVAPPAVLAPEVSRAMSDLQVVREELLNSRPDPHGRRAKALQYVNSALRELEDLSGQEVPR
jgi:hypothetical protein